jgi:Zn-dependent peptidase ImmA (M78 family)
MGPIPDVARLLEAAGGVVISMRIATDKVSAAAIWARGDERPMFFINENHNGERQRFSLAHELAHVVMHEVPAPEAEDEADQFAGELLMPAKEALPHLSGGRLNLSRLVDIKHYWRVSMAFVVTRAKNLQAITERQARSLYQMLSARGYLKREPFALPPEKPQILETALKVHLSEHGYAPDELGRLAFLSEEEFAQTFRVQSASTRRLRAL